MPDADFKGKFSCSKALDLFFGGGSSVNLDKLLAKLQKHEKYSYKVDVSLALHTNTHGLVKFVTAYGKENFKNENILLLGSVH